MQIGVGDHQWRQEAQHVAVRAAGEDEQAGGVTGRRDRRRGGRVGFERAGPDQLHGEHRAPAAHLGDPRVPVRHGPQAVGRHRPDPAGRRDQVQLVHGLDRRERRRAGDRVAAVRAAEATGVHRVHQVGPPGDGGQRQAAGDPLGDGDQVRLDALVLAGEPVARAAEAGLDLVGDEDHPGRRRPPAQRRQEPRRGYHETALALDRLDQQGGDVLRADLLLHRLDGPRRRLGAGQPPSRSGYDTGTR